LVNGNIFYSIQTYIDKIKLSPWVKQNFMTKHK